MKDEKSKRAKEQKSIRAHEQKLLVTYALMTYALILAGCAPRPSSFVHLPSALEGRETWDERRELMEKAEDVLTCMHFTIDKFDPNTGFIKTRPLPGAQFFELWRSDNIGTKNWMNSNLHSIRRTAEIILRRSEDASYGGCSGEALAKQSSIDDRRVTTDELSCIVRVQRLSLPAREVTSSARVYQMFSISGPGLQTLQIHTEQQQRMAWIDLGRDTELETEIIKRIRNKCNQLIVHSSSKNDLQ